MIGKAIGAIAALVLLVVAVYVVLPPTTTSVIGTDPRTISAGVSYQDENGEWDRGLKMTDDTFDFMACDHDAYERQSMRDQVNSAEQAYMRHYVVETRQTDYYIENGVIVGSAPHTE